MGLVLWIDKNTFAAALLEKVFKGRNLGFYSLPSAQDFSYIADDLRPSLLVLDAVTALEAVASVERQFTESSILRTLPLVMINDLPGLEFLNKSGEIKRPFDPYKIPELLLKFDLQSNHE